MNGGATALLLAAAIGIGAGCAGDDACKGRGETCLSLTLLGAEGVSEVDQLQLILMRAPKSSSPAMALGSPQRLPVKVAVFWPDGAGTVSVQGFLGGALTGVTAEISVDLRNGAHGRRALTLFPPLPGGGARDMGRSDLRTPDLRMPDLRMPADDLSVAMDLASVDGAPTDGAAPDAAVSDAAATSDGAAPDAGPASDGAAD